MSTITERSSKTEIIDSACELIDLQGRQIKTLEERQAILGISTALLALLLFFS